MAQDFNAYWISPQGDIIGVPTIHIAMIIGNPEKFGLTKEAIEEVYAKHGEPIGHEGKAREEIMLNLIVRKGWIRARYVPRQDVWSVELNKLNSKAKDNVWQFFATITGEMKMNESRLLREFASKYSDVRLIELRTETEVVPHKTSIQDILAFRGLFEGVKKELINRLITIDEYAPEINYRTILEQMK